MNLGKHLIWRRNLHPVLGGDEKTREANDWHTVDLGTGNLNEYIYTGICSAGHMESKYPVIANVFDTDWCTHLWEENVSSTPDKSVTMEARRAHLRRECSNQQLASLKKEPDHWELRIPEHHVPSEKQRWGNSTTFLLQPEGVQNNGINILNQGEMRGLHYRTSSENKRCRTRFTRDEERALLAGVVERWDKLFGCQSLPRGSKSRIWNDIAASISVSSKEARDGEDVRKKWLYTRQTLMNRLQSGSQLGLGAYPPDFSALERRVLALMGHHCEGSEDMPDSVDVPDNGLGPEACEDFRLVILPEMEDQSTVGSTSDTKMEYGQDKPQDEPQDEPLPIPFAPVSVPTTHPTSTAASASSCQRQNAHWEDPLALALATIKGQQDKSISMYREGITVLSSLAADVRRYVDHALSAGTAEPVPWGDAQKELYSKQTTAKMMISQAPSDLQVQQPPTPAPQPPPTPAPQAPQAPQPPSAPAPQAPQPPSAPAPQAPQPPSAPAAQAPQPPSAPAPQAPQPPSAPAPQAPQPPSAPAPQPPPALSNPIPQATSTSTHPAPSTIPSVHRSLSPSPIPTPAAYLHQVPSPAPHIAYHNPSTIYTPQFPQPQPMHYNIPQQATIIQPPHTFSPQYTFPFHIIPSFPTVAYPAYYSGSQPSIYQLPHQNFTVPQPPVAPPPNFHYPPGITMVTPASYYPMPFAVAAPPTFCPAAPNAPADRVDPAKSDPLPTVSQQEAVTGSRGKGLVRKRWGRRGGSSFSARSIPYL